MSPEELHWQLVEAARQWRDDERAGRLATRPLPADYELVWVDTGSGPGYEILVPVER